MRTRLRAGIALVVLFATKGMAQAPDQSSVVGHWSGVGTFFDVALQKRVGPLAIDLTIGADGTGSGRLGAAAIRVNRVRSLRDILELRADLAGVPAPDAALDKRHLFFVVTAVSDSTMQGEFHLKSNRFYDPWMREGRLRLTRVR